MAVARTAPDFVQRIARQPGQQANAGGGRRPWRPPSGSRALREKAALAAAYLGATFKREMEARRGFQWLPVAFGAGILGYFALPGEPSVLALIGLAAALALSAWRNRDRAVARRTLVVLAAVFAGTATAKIRTDLVAAPMLPRELTATVVGWIAGVEETATGGRRVYIRVDHIGGLRDPAPRTVRVTIRSKAETLKVGDAISVLAGLTSPSGPAQPGAYDFAQAAFYQGVGAYGFSFGAAKPAKLGNLPISIILAQPVAALREGIRQRVEAALPGEAGHIAAALIMGDQNGISEQTQENMRASGLGHVLSISGLHMALVAGSVFWLLRALFALSPVAALSRPIKKWAAVAALAVAAAYLAISGAEVATVRAFVMLAVMLGAVLLERRALTLRNVALAALVVLILTPEAVLSVSFQMSFAATAALVGAYEAIATRDRIRIVVAAGHPLVERIRRDATGLVLTSLIAGLATAPFAAYHFQRLAPLTLLANLAAMPVIGLIVMPMALAAAILIPFGLEVVPLKVMEWGLAWMAVVAAKTAEWSSGYGSVAMPSGMSLLAAVIGFLWLVLWRERWRLAGLVPMALALPLAAATPHPDVIVNADGSAAAVRAGDGRLRLLGSDAFIAENWLRADGDARGLDDRSLSADVSCDRWACVAKTPQGTSVALVLKPEAFAEECRRSHIVLSAHTAPRDCSVRAVVIDGPELRSGGAHALYPDGSTYRIEVAYSAVRRPFMPPAPAR